MSVIRRIAVAFFLTFVFSLTIGINTVSAACNQSIQKWDWCGGESGLDGNSTGLFLCVIYTVDANGYPNGYKVFKEHLTRCEADPTAWDAENRLVKAEVVPNSVYYTFTYDGLNRRIGAKYTNQGVTSESRYLWCGEEICQKRSATDVVTGRYFSEGEVVVSSGLRAYYARDHLGSVRDVLDVSTGNIIRSIDYYPNGKIKNSSGTFEPEFEFAGMQSFPYMASGGALLTYYRVYDPALGRWLSRDTIEEAGGINLYGYVGGNFVNQVDTSGLNPALAGEVGFTVGETVVAPVIESLVYAATGSTLGGLAYELTHPNPMEMSKRPKNRSESVHPEEQELLDATCDDKSWAIPELKALIASLEGTYKGYGGGNVQVNPNGPGHPQRIAILNKKLKWFEECPKECE